jgi:hypothetical protein
MLAETPYSPQGTNSQVLIDLACFPVLPQQPAKNPLPSHPEDLGGHTSLGSTLSLTGTSVTTLALRRKELLCTSPRVDSGGLNDNTTILDELLDVSAGVGVPDLSLFGGVKPNFALADAGDGCGEPLLRTKVDHV